VSNKEARKLRRPRRLLLIAGAVVLVLAVGVSAILFMMRPTVEDDAAIARACAEMVGEGLPGIAAEQTERFTGKVSDAKLRCRGGERALAQRDTPWVDWSNYWGTGDARSLSDRFGPASHLLNRGKRGIDGALLDFEIQRMELIRFNLYDNETYETYAGDPTGPIRKVWPEMRLPDSHPRRGDVETDDNGNQECTGDLIRFRSVSGICNDIRNPAMGAAGQLFDRNVAFEATFPELGLNELARNRHGERIGLLKPDPQLISRRLLQRDQSAAPNCNQGRGVPGMNDARCDYQTAPFFNVLAAFWIQFMTHDWFSHLDEARNDTVQLMTDLGCRQEDLTPSADSSGCRPEDKIEAALAADTEPPGTFRTEAGDRLKRAPRTSRNMVTAWWDASQIYGWDERSRARVLRDPDDPAKLLLEAGPEGRPHLPVFSNTCLPDSNQPDCVPMQPEWAGQEAVAFPDNWSLGISFYHNLFAREHNAIVDEFRRMAQEHGGNDSGLRHPDAPDQEITYGALSDQEIFEVARLVVAAEIAKIHTIEWTTQLLYNEPLYAAMNSNWSGLFQEFPLMSEVSERLVKRLADSDDPQRSSQLYSAFAAGAGIVGRGSERKFPPYVPDWMSWDRWHIDNPDDVNGGTNHFGAPFNFPEDFVSVYRLHALVPDMLEDRDLAADPNAVQAHLPVVDTFRAGATDAMHERGLANVALSMGRQRLGLLQLQNHPQFLQNLDLRPRLDTMIDVPALDIIRDRERGTPRFNEFRRQIGLRQLTSFDDFIDKRLPEDSAQRAIQERNVALLREVYGQHVCDASKIITDAQLDSDGAPITDCLGHADGTLVDNVEDLDLVVGFHAETTRPHGFAISETQFHIFILNASRRLFSDRFFTSSFRPEFYTHLGIDWVNNNGPTGKQWETGEQNGHMQEVLPLKRVLLRAMPELEDELAPVVNAFDPWARDRGEYYSIAWKPRAGAEDDPTFSELRLDGAPTGAERQWREEYRGGSREAEQAMFEDFADTVTGIQEKTIGCTDAETIHRAFHAKSVAALNNATLRFRDDLHPELRTGFAQPGAAYPATIRLSNAASVPGDDADPDMRGFALRIAVSDDQTHDLLLTNQAVSHARDAEQFVVFADALTCGGLDRMLGIGRLVGAFGISETQRMIRHVQAGRNKTVESLALETYWSRGAIRWGDVLAVRYLLRPAQDAATVETTDATGPDALRSELAARLAGGDVRFDLYIQPFINESLTPIEDASVEWTEAVSPPILVATLTIPSQDLTSDAAQSVRAAVDDMAFNPWNAPEDFRPLGNINRVRYHAYKASSSRRGAAQAADAISTGAGN
jgi:hypothetical protein